MESSSLPRTSPCLYHCRLSPLASSFQVQPGAETSPPLVVVWTSAASAADLCTLCGSVSTALPSAHTLASGHCPSDLREICAPHTLWKCIPLRLVTVRGLRECWCWGRVHAFKKAAFPGPFSGCPITTTQW